MQAAARGAARRRQHVLQAGRPAPAKTQPGQACKGLMLRPNTYLTKRTRARARRASKGASTTAARRACLAQLGPPEPDEVWVAGGDGAAEHCCSAPRAGGGDLLDGQELPRKIVERLHGTSPASARSERAHESFSVGLPSLCCVLKVQAAVASNKVSSDRPMPLWTPQRGLRMVGGLWPRRAEARQQLRFENVANPKGRCGDEC